MVTKNKYLSDTGHLKDEYISLYIDAHILDKVNELPQEILEHVEDCQVCKQNIINVYDLMKNIDSIKHEEHPYFNFKKSESINLKKTNFSVFFRIAASLLIIICIGMTGYYFLNNTQRKINKFSKSENILKDSTKLENNTLEDSTDIKDRIKEDLKIKIEDSKREIEINELIAENELEGEEFQVSPIMLSMLGTTSRSDFLEVKEPKDSTIFKYEQVVNFSWNSDIEEEIKLKIFNYKDELVFESKELKTDEFTLTEPLLSGAYIWKIESTDEMYYLGLFFIVK